MMFDIPLFRRKAPEVRPLAVSKERSQEILGAEVSDEALQGVATLISKEDIYYRTGGQQVLLLKAGQHVPLEMVPTLLKFGVTPRQFLLGDGEQAMPEEQVRHMFGMSPLSGGEPPAAAKGLRRRFVLFDADDRSLHRLVDCLVAMGVPMANVHPVLRQEVFRATVSRYQPDVLFYGFTLDPENPGIGRTMTQIRQFCTAGQVILVLKSPPLSESVRREVLQLAKTHGADVLFKPVNRYHLSDLLLVAAAT